jgi:thymidylate synthase
LPTPTASTSAPKGYGNLVELASLQQQVAGQLGQPAGRLLMLVKSAHIYETERG